MTSEDPVRLFVFGRNAETDRGVIAEWDASA
jgi:hypothetical protein